MYLKDITPTFGGSMIDRKAALMSAREGQWIRTAGMRGLQLRAKVAPDTLLQVRQILLGDLEAHMRMGGPGLYDIEEAVWTRVEVISGPHESALCTLESKVA